MPKFRSAKPLLQLCLESACKLVRDSADNANDQVETTSTENDALDEIESASKCVANPFEELHSSLLEQVVDSMRWISNIKELDLLITKQTRKLNLSRARIKNKHEIEHVLQLAASRCLKLTSGILFSSEFNCPLEYYHEFLPQFKQLQVLKVSWSSENFDDSCLQLLGIYCIDLRELDISYCNVTDDGIEQLCGGTTVQGKEKLKSLSYGQCKAIQELTIDGTKITVKGVQMALLHLPDLKILKSSLVIEALRVTHQNERICAKYALRQLVLEDLNLSPPYLYQNGDLQLAASRCPLVTHLDIGIDVGITDSDLLGVVVLVGLRDLKISYCNLQDNSICRITFDGGLAPLLQARGNSLKSLHLRDLPESISVHLDAVVECCQNLKRLVFECVYLAPARLEEDGRTSSRPSKRIKSDFVLNYLEELTLVDTDCCYRRHHIKELLLLTPPTLKKLTFLNCDDLNDDILRQVLHFRSFKNLEVFVVGGCHAITKDGINLFLNGENSLNYLAVCGCELVSDDDTRKWEDEAEKKNLDLFVEVEFIMEEFV